MTQRSHRKRNFRTSIVTTLSLAVFLAVGLNLPADSQTEAPVSVQDREIRTLRDLNDAFTDLAAAAKPTVVTVATTRTIHMRGGGSPFASPFFDFFFGPNGPNNRQPRQREFQQRGLGSGVIVSADGYILSNNHVIADADSIFVQTFSGDRYEAKIIGADPKTDIAVLKIDADNLPYIEPGNSEELEVGEIVIAVGSPMSENLAYTVTQGIVSATGRSNVGLAEYEDFIQTDAAINPGNSGGPLINLDGDLIGINTAIASRTGGFQGIGFAVPINMAKYVMNSLIEEGKVVRGWLGVYIQEVNEQLANAMGLDEESGALIGEVTDDGPAARAGVEPGDLVIAMDNETIEDPTELKNRVAATAPGTTVELTVIRDGNRRAIDVTLGELPGETGVPASGGQTEQRLNFNVAELTDVLARQYDIDRRLSGVVVTSVAANSNAAQAGLQEGDLIRAVDRQRVQSVKQFEIAVADKEKGDTILLRIHRQGGGFYIAFTL